MVSKVLSGDINYLYKVTVKWVGIIIYTLQINAVLLDCLGAHKS